MTEEFYKNFVDDLVEKTPGLWYNAFILEKEDPEKSYNFYSWGVGQANRENYKDDYISCRTKPCHKSYKELAEDIAEYLNIEIK